MTLAQAEAISSVVPEVVASRGSSGFCRRSQLGNWSLVEISNAFALMIAKNRQLVDQDPNARRLCRDYAEKAAAVLASLRMTVIHDAEADRLSKLDRDSAEYDEARRKLVISLLQDQSPEGQRFLKLESLESFNKYCWTLDAADLTYWKKIYDRLNVPFDEKAQTVATSANAVQ